MKRHSFLIMILLAAATAMAQKHVSDLVVTPPFGGGTIKWYDAATGGNQIMNPGATVLVTGTTYYATQTLNGVESTVRTAVIVTLDALPAAPDAITGGAANVCINAATPAFTDNTSGGTWSIAAGSGTASITQGGVVTGLTAGTVNVIYTTAANAAGCTNFASKPLTVYSSFTAGAIATAGETLCAGGNPALIGSSSPAGGGDGTITYTWKSSVSGDFTDAVVLSGNNSATYTPAAGLTQTTSYRRYANDVTCNPDPALSAGTWVVTITPLPTPSFTAQPGATANTGANVTYTTQSGKSAYVWTFPGTVTTDYTLTSGGTSTDYTVTLKYVTGGSKIVSINYTANGCTAASATSSTETTVSAPPALGVAYQGGIVAYLFVNGDPGYVPGEIHGLIAAISDNATSKWGCIGNLTSATGTALGTGNQNTIKIMNICSTTGIAARLCSNLGAGWYLPSKDELYKLYLNRAAIGNFDTSGTGLYWTSTEDANSHDNWNSFYYTFSDGSLNAKDKDEFYKSRAIKSF